MRNFPTIFLMLLAAGLGSLVVVQQLRGNLDSIFGAPAKSEGDLVYEFSPKDVGEIHIASHGGANAVIQKKGGAWMMEKPFEDFADARWVQSLISFSSSLIIEDIINRDEVEDLTDYGLRDSRIEVELFDTSGNPICHFRIGRYTAWRSIDEEENNFSTVVIRPAERGQKDYLYVCADRVDPKLRTEPIRSLFDHSLRRVRDPRAFYNHPFFASEVSIKDKTAEISIKRATIKKEEPWKIAKPFQLSTDPAAVQKLLTDLGNLEALAVLDPSAVTLPAPLPENIDRTISARFFLPNGGVSDPVSVFIYPPEKPDSPTVYARIGETPEKLRPAVLRLPRGAESSIAQLPTSVNQLRSRSLTSLAVKQLESFSMKDDTDRPLTLNLEWNPHERAKRWYTKTPTYHGPANEAQVKALFETLFTHSISRFADDAVTEPAAYGLDKPIREFTINLKNQDKLSYRIGLRPEKHYYARTKGGSHALEVSELLFGALAKGTASPKLDPLFAETPNGLSPISDPSTFGFNKARTVKIETSTGLKEIELGEVMRPHYYANQADTKRVSEIPASFLNAFTTEDFRWRQQRLWNLNPFEVRGIIIERRGHSPLTLTYNFFRQSWKAEQDGKDVTARLNFNKTDRLLEKLAELRVHKWLGSNSPHAAVRIQDPNLKISVLTEEINSEGELLGLRPQTLSISQVISGKSNKFFYGKSSSDNDYFLLNLGTVKRLAVKLLE